MEAPTDPGTSLPLAGAAQPGTAAAHAHGRPAAAEVVALFGPTGIGKTDVAIALADLLRVRGERPVAISADALQVYSGLETLTGAASTRDRARLEHRLISFVEPTATFSVGEFMPLAHTEIDRAIDAGRRPIVVGGTGLYLRAALTDLELRPPPPPGLRERIEAEIEQRGLPALHHALETKAPAVAATIEPTDRSRIIRALELAELSQLEEEPATGAESQLWTADTRRPTLLFGLTMDRDQLYARIDARVDAMLQAGAQGEVQAAAAAGASQTARKALGFEELLSGDVEAMKRRTRNYAKRQLTWMRKLAGVRVIDTTGRDPLDTAAEIARVLA
jgi:tRNA dimethylallyltransferase